MTEMFSISLILLGIQALVVNANNGETNEGSVIDVRYPIVLQEKLTTSAGAGRDPSFGSSVALSSGPPKEEWGEIAEEGVFLHKTGWYTFS
jgi:hypothetical protein